MTRRNTAALAAVALVTAALTTGVGAQSQEPPKIKIPEPGVPADHDAWRASYVRAAYNNEGYVILGYQLANRSVGEEWMLLEVGVDGARRRAGLHADARGDLARDAGRQDAARCRRSSEYREANLRALEDAGEGPARLDQLLPAEREPRRAASGSSPTRTAGRWPGTRSSSADQRALPRPALLPDSGRDHVRPALAQRQVREEPGARAVPDPDQGRGEDCSTRTTRTSRSR